MPIVLDHFDRIVILLGFIVHLVSLSSSVFILYHRLLRTHCAFISVCTMLYLILLHLFACCVTLIVVNPVIHHARTVVNDFIDEYASDEED